MSDVRQRAAASVLTVLLCTSSGGCAKPGASATPPPSGVSSTPPTSRTPSAPVVDLLQAGVARTPEELAACRAEEARRAAEKSREHIDPPAQPVTLRREPKDLTLDACREMVRHWNFYGEKNTEGCFVNVFRRNDLQVVADLSTGLLWQSATSGQPLLHSEIAPYLAQLNRDRLGGFSDWRLPTLEEGFSLIESIPFNNTHTDKLLFVTRTEWWTSDTHEGAPWILFTVIGACLPVSVEQNTRHYVRAVRTLP